MQSDVSTGEPVRADGLPVHEERGKRDEGTAGAEDDAVGEALVDTERVAEAPSSAAAPDVAEGDAAANDVLERFELRLEEAQRLLARQTDHVEHLHAENQRLRQGELRTALLPLVRDLLRVHDDLARLTGIGEATVDDLEIARHGILDALARNGIVASATSAGASFDPRMHRAEAPVDTDDPARHRTIAETLRGGFAWEDGTIVRPADVRVYTHVPAAEPTPTPNPTTTDDDQLTGAA